MTYRLNILRLHDEKNAANPNYAVALAAMGYPSQGLYHSVVNTNKQVGVAAATVSTLESEAITPALAL